MIIVYDRKFRKSYSKLNSKITAKFENRLVLFTKRPSSRILNIHKLSGKYDGMWSINITGDYRAIFEKMNDGNIVFINIGTHSELFG